MSLIRKISLLILLIAGCGKVGAQQVDVDVNAIGVEVAMNPAAYRALLDRFIAGDSLMTAGEMATVYYGWSFTPDYSPDENNATANEAFDSGDWKLASFLASEGLQRSPLSLDLTTIGLLASKHAGESELMNSKVRNLGTRFNMIAAIILASGNGTTPDSPFKVICYNDILRVLKNVVGAREIIGRSRVGNIEAIKIRLDDTEREHILYFDNTRQKQVDATNL